MRYTLFGGFLFLSFSLFGQMNIKGIVTDAAGEPILGVSIFTEWIEAGAIKREFTSSLSDGSFLVSTQVLPCKIFLEHISYGNISKTIKDTTFKIIKMGANNRVNTIRPLILNSVRESGHNSSQVKVDSRQLNTQNSSVDLPLMLRFQPSVTTTSDAGNGIGYSGIRLRGTDASRINVTLNGIPMNDAESQGVWWVNTPDLASGLDNIQITRGVGSSTNGAAAFGGTVSLASIDPARTVSKAEVAYGSFNSLRTTLSVNTGFVNGFAGGVRVSNISSDGYIDRASSKLQSYQVNLAYQWANTKLRFIHLKGSERTYQSWYGYEKNSSNPRTYNVAGEYVDKQGQTQFYDNQTDNYGQSHYQFFLDHSILNEDDLTITVAGGLHYSQGQGYYEEYKSNQLLSNYKLPNDTTDLVRQLWLMNDFMGAVYSINVNTPRMNWTFGGGLHRYQGNHFGNIVRADRSSNINFNQRYYDNDANKNEWSNYIKGTRTWVVKGQRVKLFGDVQLRAVDYSAQGVNDNQSAISFEENFLFLNPKIGASVLTRTRNVSKSWDVFLGMAHREPSRTDFITQAKIPQPERLLNLELGRSYLHKNWAIMANYYMMYYQNQLILTGELNNVGTPLRENVGRSYRSGIELVGKYKWGRKWELGANITLSQNRLIDYSEEVVDENFVFDTLIKRDQAPLAFSPSIISGVNISYKLRRNLKITLQNKFVGQQYIDNTGIEEKSLSAYNTTDLIINYSYNLQRFTRSNLPINITAYLYNITNSLYENNGWAYSVNDQGNYTNYVGVYPQAPFNVMLKLGVMF